MAECIRCGRRFLLPVTTSLTRQDANTAATAIVVDGPYPAPEAERRCRLPRAAVALTFSFIVNSTLLFLLGLFYFHNTTTDAASVLHAEFSEERDNDFTILPEFDLGGAAPAEALLQSTVTASEISVTDPGQITSDNGTVPDGIGRLGSGHGKGHGGRGAGIFGGIGSAKSFAYVVDASGSMSGPRMALVLDELRQSLMSLKEDQSFFVVFFNERTFPMMWPKIEKRLIVAHQLNKERVINWAFTVEPNEATMPEQALRMALHLEPDIVFFLTDGDIPEGSLRIVKKYREDKTSVHTICVGEEAAVPVMQEIAVVGHGEFLMVSE